MDIIWFILIGVAAGFLGGVITKGHGFGFVINFAVGIVGGVLGGWLFGLFGLQSTGRLGSLLTATIGAIVLLGILSLFKKKE